MTALPTKIYADSYARSLCAFLHAQEPFLKHSGPHWRVVQDLRFGSVTLKWGLGMLPRGNKWPWFLKALNAHALMS